MKKTTSSKFKEFEIYIDPKNDGLLCGPEETYLQCVGCRGIIKQNQMIQHRNDCMMLHMKTVVHKKNFR